MRSFATACLVLVLLVGLASGKEGPRIGPEKKIIHLFQSWPTAKYLKENIQEMQSLPLDGFVIWATTVIDGKENVRFEFEQQRLLFRWWSPEEIGEEQVAEMVRDLKATDFGRFTDNFLLVHSQSYPLPAPSWWDDEVWKKITANMVLAARIAKECGLKGIFFEAEHYGAAESPYIYRFNYSYAHGKEKELLERGLIDKVHTWEEFASAARRRGREIMSAMCNVYPNITVLSHPGWHENAKFRRDLFSHKHLSGSDYGLLAPFADGLLEGAGEEGVICDGNTNCYPLTLNKRFVARRQMVKDAHDVSAVPDLYKKRMKVACGIWMEFHQDKLRWYTDPQDFSRNHFTPIDLGNALYFGLLNSDRYVWLYSELDGAVFLENVHGHWQDPKEHAKPTVSDEYLLEISRAREPRDLDTGRDNSPVAEIPIPKSATELPSYSDEATFGPLEDRYRVVSDLPEQWLFFADDEDLGATLAYHTIDTDVSGWNPIRIGDYFQRQGYRFRGNAWYRCSFRVPKELEGKKVFLIFGGVAASRPQVWLNAELFTKQCDVEESDGVLIVDISKQAKYGEDNIVVVAIVTKDGKPAGIYKSVKLARTIE